MTRHAINLTSRTTAESYASFMAGLLPFAAMCGFIINSSRLDSESSLLAPLDQYLIRIDTVTGWPGTELPSGFNALRYLYPFSEQVLEILLDTSSDLFDWHFPSLPDDLHLLRDDESTVLGSIAVHKRAWLEFDEDELSRWRSMNSDEVVRLVSAENSIPGTVRGIGALMGETMGGEVLAAALRPLMGELNESLRDSVANYLTRGRLVLTTAITTRDQLEGQFEVPGGADILSDGVYCWRRDSSHYVAAFAIGIPEDAIQHFRAMDWAVPDLTESETDDIEEFLWVDF